MLMDISKTVKFIDICMMLEKIRSANVLDKKQNYVRKYFESFQKHRQTFLESQGLPSNQEEGNSSFYCVLRCLMPSADNARRAYGLQITTLGHLYIKILKLNKDCKETRHLMHFRGLGRKTDYADLLYGVLLTRCRTTPSTLSLHQIHSMLDSILEGDRENTEVILTSLTETCSPIEQKWFIRLLLKNMSLGIGEQKILSVLHPEAHAMLQRCSTMQKLCCLIFQQPHLTKNEQVAEQAVDIEDKKNIDLSEVIEPFNYIKPMLCEIFPGNIKTLMGVDVIYVETKQDGERFQLHYSNGRFEYFSRNGINYTSSFGGSFEHGSLTPFLKALLPIGIKSIILDGEMMVWDTEEQCYRDKGENTDVKHLTSQQQWRPCFVVYDLLYLNGHCLLNLPYVQRTYKLRACLQEKVGILQIMKPYKVSSVEDFKQKYQSALDANEEGIVLKMKGSIYRPGRRNGGGWYKIKADYIEGLTSDFDLIIMGGYYNKSHTYVESFLLGVLKFINDDNYEVYSVAKVANNTRRRRVLNDILCQHWKHVSQEPPPQWYHYVKHSPEGCPDVWIDPCKSTVLLIKAADLVRSMNFALPKSLHFPRIMAWRNDKLWHESHSLQDYMQVCQLEKGIQKIYKRPLSLADITKDRKKQKLTFTDRRKLFSKKYESQVDDKNITKTSRLFAGLSFCILSGNANKNLNTSHLSELVLKNGGNLVQNPIPYDPQCILIADDITCRVEKLINSANYDILSAQWLLKTCNRQYLQILPHDLICATSEMNQKMKSSCDAYGDSFSQPVDIYDLNEIFNQMEVSSLPTEYDVLKLDLQKVEFFANYCAFFLQCQESMQHLFKFRGGTIYGNIDSFISNLKTNSLNNFKYIVFYNPHKLSSNELSQWLNLKGNRQSVDMIKKLDVQFIYDSHILHKLQDIDNYI